MAPHLDQDLALASSVRDLLQRHLVLFDADLPEPQQCSPKPIVGRIAGGERRLPVVEVDRFPRSLEFDGEDSVDPLRRS